EAEELWKSVPTGVARIVTLPSGLKFGQSGGVPGAVKTVEARPSLPVVVVVLESCPQSDSWPFTNASNLTTWFGFGCPLGSKTVTITSDCWPGALTDGPIATASGFALRLSDVAY